jgi:hypothetical protein
MTKQILNTHNFDPPSTALARAVLAYARLGLHEAALNEAAVAAAAQDWDRVIAASNRARSHASTEAQRAAADARLTQARNAKFCSALDAAQTHLSAGRWEHAEASANSARHYADRAMDVNAACAVLLSVSAQRDAAEEAEPEYINAVDDFIRRRPDFSGDRCVCLLLQYPIQSCARGGRRIVEDMCYEIRRAEACVD